MAPLVALAAIVLLASSRLVAGSRTGVILRPTGVPAWPPARRSSRCRNLLARERTPIGDTARQLSQKPVELADKLHLEVGFNRPALLNVLVPLNPRHFSDAVNEVKMHIANACTRTCPRHHFHVHMQDLASARARCPDCTCGYSEQRGGYSLCNSAASKVPSVLARSRQCGHPPPLQRPLTLAQRPRWKALSARVPRRGCGGAPVPVQRGGVQRGGVDRFHRLWPIQAPASGATRRRAG